MYTLSKYIGEKINDYEELIRVYILDCIQSNYKIISIMITYDNII